MAKTKTDRSAPRRALVTGASGFVGGHLARRLASDGWEVHCVLRNSRKRGLLAGWEKRIKIHVHDGSTESLCGIVKSAAPDVVFHLASLFIAEHTTADVAPLVDSNVRLAAQLAEGMTCAGASRLVNTGSAWEHFRDDEPVNLYAATKQATSALFRFYAASSRLRVITLKLFDSYGPGDMRSKLIPRLIEASGSGRRIALSPGRQRLDLVYIDDITAAYLAAADRLFRKAAAQKLTEEYAVSSGCAWSLRQVVAAVAKEAGREIQVDWGARPYRRREVMKPWQTGRKLPGWNAGVNLCDGLRRMIAVDRG